VVLQSVSAFPSGDVFDPEILRSRLRLCANQYISLSRILPVVEGMAIQPEDDECPLQILSQAVAAIRDDDREAAARALGRLASEFSIPIALGHTLVREDIAE
jgi:hypothetical protein